MHFIVYRITNMVSGKTYVGCHKTANLDDGYMGSGVAIRAAIKKYGLASFTKEVLIDCASADEMFEQECALVEVGPHSYNLAHGGKGGTLSAESIAKLVATRRARGFFSPEGRARIAAANRKRLLGSHRPQDEKDRIAAAMSGRPPNNKGKPRSEAAKKKQSESTRGIAFRSSGFKQSPEWIAAAAQRMQGNKHAVGTVWTPEQRAALSASQRARRAREKLQRQGASQ